MKKTSSNQLIKSLILECVKELFNEAAKQGDEQDVRGLLGYPFDGCIVPGSIQIDDAESSSSKYIYSWKLRVFIDDPAVISNLTEDEETFEEKLLNTLSERLRSPAKTKGGQFTTGFAEVESRGSIRGRKFLLIKVELTVGMDV